MRCRTMLHSARSISRTATRCWRLLPKRKRSCISARFRWSGPSRRYSVANIRGTYHVFELARLAKSRVIFASSNHTIGFHERGRLLAEDCDLRPDTFYGLSKAYGELLARLYWDKHGVESLSIRIGTCLPKPKDPRHLSTWLSHDDLVRMIEAGVNTPLLGCRLIWGVSQNQRSWWKSHDQKMGDLRKHDASHSPIRSARLNYPIRSSGATKVAFFAPRTTAALRHRLRIFSPGCPRVSRRTDACQRKDCAGKPVIAIVNAWSDLNLCHAHARKARGSQISLCRDLF